MQAKESGVPKVLLIDLDNCPKQLEALERVLDTHTRVVICHGGNEPKVPLDLVRVLATALSSGALEIVGMKRKTKNAADFGLTFAAGRLCAEMPADTEFTIVSNDTDLDHAVELLTRAGRKVSRVSGAPVADDLPGDPTTEAAAREFAAMIRKRQNFPRTRKTLRHSIKSWSTGKSPRCQPDSMIEHLLASGFIHITGSGKVSYPSLDGPPDVDDDLPF